MSKKRTWLARDPAEPGEARKSAVRVIEQGRRASDVVTGLKSFVRDAQLRFTDIQIIDAVEEILLLLKRDLEPADIALRTDFDRSTPNVEGDRVQLLTAISSHPDWPRKNMMLRYGLT